MKKGPDHLPREKQHRARLHPGLCLLALTALVIWTGCRQEANKPAEINPVGTYALVSVDGNKVPCALKHEGVALTVKSGAFILGADGTCSSKVTFSPPSGGEVSREVKATYTREGAKLTMRWEGAGITTGAIEGDRFTMENEGMVFAYLRSGSQPKE